MSEMESHDCGSDCVITAVTDSRGNVLMINDEQNFLKRCKLKYEEGFHIKAIPGDDHCIKNFFAINLRSHLIWSYIFRTHNSEKALLFTLLFTKISLNL